MIPATIRSLVRTRLAPLVVVPALFMGWTPAARAGGAITSSSVVAGTISSPTYSETWTFSGTSKDRVLIAAVTTSGSVNTTIRLKDPSNVEVINTTADRADYQLLATGTYTLIIEDSGLNDTGSYSLSFLNVTAGPLTNGMDTDGGAIASGEVKAGQMNAVADFDAFTFSGTAGDRVVIGALATGGASFNTNIALYPPGGGAAEAYTYSGDRVDQQLLTTGTYTVVVEDYPDTYTGTYSLSLLNLTAGPLTTVADPDGGAIASGDVKVASLQTGPDFDAFTFIGVGGNRILVDAVTTTGTPNTSIYVYPPGGASAVLSTTADRIEYQLATSGTYTILIEDSGLNDTGSYTLSMLNLAGPLTTGSDLDGGTIASAEVKSGQMNAIVDFDAFTFTGVAGNRVVLGALATGGSGFNTNIALYPPGGGPAEAYSYSGDRVDTQLLMSGTYTAVIEDYGNTHTGTYTLSFLDVTGGPLTSGSDADGGSIGSGEVKNASLQTAPDFDAFTFTGTGGSRILIDAVATSGTPNTMISLYPPGGGPAVVSTTADRVEYQLIPSGKYTILIEDSGLNDTGSYSLSMLNVTSGPLTTGSDPDGGAIASAEVKTGQMNAIVDFDAFTFTGVAGHRIVFGALETGGVGFNTTISLYPPGGGNPEAYTYSGNRLDVQLLTSGTYTAVIEDYGNTHTGTYTVSLLDVTGGPLTSGPDPDGGAMASGDVRTGSLQTTPDFDAFTLTATAGDRLLIDAITTTGTANTSVYLYPPGGGAALVATTADRVEYQVLVTGTWTILIEDSGNNETGSYTLSLLDVTSGPLTTLADPDGGAMVSTDVKTGQMNAVVDFDAWTFNGSAGDRVVIGTIATGGIGFNTNMALYPPGGGAAEAYTYSGDRIDVQLARTGGYTLVVEDYGNAHTGTYSLSLLNVTHGLFTSSTDHDGNGIVSNTTRMGQMQTAPDFDAYIFYGAAGDTAVMIATTVAGLMNTTVYLYPPYGGAPVVATTPDFDAYIFYGAAGDTAVMIATTVAGLMNTAVYLYPPYGGLPVVNTTADNVTYVLTTTGLHTIEIEDSGTDETGTYTLYFRKSGTVTGADDPLLPARFVADPPRPNPFTSTTRFVFALPEQRDVSLRVFDMRGALVRSLVDGPVPAGGHAYAWDGRSDGGARVAGGIYYAELRAGRDVARNRIVVMR